MRYQFLGAFLVLLSTDVGILEVKKHAILHEIAGVNGEQEDYKKVLEEKYGRININLEDGTFTHITENE